jgi:hypothetical protein
VKQALALAVVFAMGACAPAVAPRSAPRCSAAEIDRFLADCVEEGALIIHCQQFASTHASCNDCLRPKSGVGPVRERAGGVEANLEGCRARHACGSVDAGDSPASLRMASLAFCGP